MLKRSPYKLCSIKLCQYKGCTDWFCNRGHIRFLSQSTAPCLLSKEPDKSEFGTKPERLKAYFPPFTTHISTRKSADFTVSKGFEMLVRNSVVAGAVASAATGSGGEPQPDRRRRQPQARPAPSCAVDAGRQGSRRGAPRVGTWWTCHRHVASALLCKERFTDLRFHQTDAFSRAEEDTGTCPAGQVSRKNNSFSHLPGSRGTCIKHT